jgi:hypothetical protein
MKKINWPTLLLWLNLAVISLIILFYANRLYPMVGHDYGYAVPQMLDSTLHFRVNGLVIQWYTPSFGGGLPAFPDPNNTQFSLLTFLDLFLQPWPAVMVSIAIFICVGGAAAYTLFSKVFQLHWPSALLGTIFFIATGYSMSRMACGHIYYQTFLLLPVIFVTLLDPSLPRLVAGLLFGVLVALMIHEASFFLIIIFGLSLLLTLPIVYIYRPGHFSLKRSLFVVGLGGGIALIASASKLSAIYSFMALFPRQIADTFSATNIFQDLTGIFLQLMGTMVLVPFMVVAKWNPVVLVNFMEFVTGVSYGWWEYDMSITPVAGGIVLLGIYLFLRRPKKYSHLFNQDRKWLAWIILALSFWLTFEFVTAKGLVYPLLRELPILNSLHVNTRFTAALIFPIALVAVLIYNSWALRWSGRKAVRMFIGLNVLALLPLSAFFMGRDLDNRTYDISASSQVYSSMMSGDPLTITDIVDKTSNTNALLTHSSNLDPYDPIFGYFLENFHPQITTGPVSSVSDGYYNMTNPAGYVFPGINGTKPFERIPVDQESELEAFVNHRQPDWKIPAYQRILDWISGLTFLAAMIVLILYAGRRLLGKRFAIANPVKANKS